MEGERNLGGRPVVPLEEKIITKHLGIRLTAEERKLVDWVAKELGYGATSQFVRQQIMLICKDYYKKYKQQKEEVLK